MLTAHTRYLSVTALVTAVAAGALTGQDPVTRPPPIRPGPRDSIQRPDSMPLAVDTALAGGLGLPTQPSRDFPQMDSIIQRLLEREGYSATRYASDSLTLFAATDVIRLKGSALVERETSKLEADSISFQQDDCLMVAYGEPALFDGETVLVGGGMRYDTCERQGIVSRALTKFNQMGIDWYLRGELAVDSAATRMYGAKNQVTTCDHPNPHYHFTASNVKWVSNNMLVARPAVLYVRDVPVMWLPFIWQDMRKGRRSGILVPRFGVNDLVRPNSGYRRHLTNFGYYFAISDYLDLRLSLDWFAGNYTAVNGQIRYNWLTQFMTGDLAVSRVFEEGIEGQPGGRSLRVQWTHNQSFNQRTRLTASVDYATSSKIIERNSVDPLVQTATLGSRINFSKQFDWGTFSAGASRSQDLSSGTVTQNLPNLSLSPAPVNFGQSITWSPSFSLSRSQTLDQKTSTRFPLPPVAGQPRDSTLLVDATTTSFRVGTPLRIGSWNWRNDFSVMDSWSNRPEGPIYLFDPDNPTDSTTVFYSERQETAIDWNTGINLPILFASSWKLQPSVGIQNTTSGAFMIRNRNTGGAFVTQGKRLSFSASSSPALFGFFPGVGPISRIRHSLSPRVTWNYQPAADVPEAYARAVAGPGGNPNLKSRPIHTISFSLSQTFEGKLRPQPGDTTSDPRNAPKIKLLNIQTSSITYDFEQAKDSGFVNGWTTSSLTNSFTSDLLRGFTLSIAHDLWDGTPGKDSTRFDPVLTSISARFSLSGATISNILALFTGGDARVRQEEEEPVGEEEMFQPAGTATSAPRGLDYNTGRMGARSLGGTGFRSSITYDERHQRPRMRNGVLQDEPPDRNLGLQVGFSPSENWSLSWNTQYNITDGEFGQHVLRLDRQMHRWRATFSFVKSPNGNFAFNFFISLRDQPDLKFQYDQQTVNR